MPELPEVETIRRCLEDDIKGETIEDVWIKRGSRLFRDTVGDAALKRALSGRKITRLDRRGKYLVMGLDSGSALVVHLGMSGGLYLIEKENSVPDHTHLKLEFSKKNLVMVDPRTFGRVLFSKAGEVDSNVVLSALAPDPFKGSFTAVRLRESLSGRKLPLKAALLDQRTAVSGLGNIYADECCFRAGVHPERPAGSLSATEAEKLHDSIKKVLAEAIECKGTTIRDYQWSEGRSGEFESRLRVYGREGEECRTCGGRISKSRIRERSTYYCPRCQK